MTITQQFDRYSGVPLSSLLTHWDEVIEAPSDEGWGLFESDTYGWEIEADNEQEQFVRDGCAYDDEAVEYVRRRALEGSEVHQLALAIHQTQERENRAIAAAAGYRVERVDDNLWRVDDPVGVIVPMGDSPYCESETQAWSVAWRDFLETVNA